MSMTSYTGACHCKAICFSFSCDTITEGLRCNYSICKRLGCVHSMKIPYDSLQLTSGEENLHTYSWGDGEIPFTFCRHCGIYVFYKTPAQCRVNLGCVDAVDTFSIHTTVFDGKHLL